MSLPEFKLIIWRYLAIIYYIICSLLRNIHMAINVWDREMSPNYITFLSSNWKSP